MATLTVVTDNVEPGHVFALPLIARWNKDYYLVVTKDGHYLKRTMHGPVTHAANENMQWYKITGYRQDPSPIPSPYSVFGGSFFCCCRKAIKKEKAPSFFSPQ